MHKPEESRQEFTPANGGAFWQEVRWLDSEHILLALAENHEDSQRHDLMLPLLWEAISSDELLAYHRQLFLWRLMWIKSTVSPMLSN